MSTKMIVTSESERQIRCEPWLSKVDTDSGSLESLPEIERENILAGRLEEMQKFKDSQALDAMYKMAGMGDEADEDEEDDEPKKRRKFISHSLAREDTAVLISHREAH